jgi:YHS domain-containing protein
MSPFRLLILIVLFYFLFKLLFGRKRPKSGLGGRVAAKHDILIEDPVCHTYVPKSQAVSLDQGEKIYYFCSKQCRESFLGEGEKP